MNPFRIYLGRLFQTRLYHLHPCRRRPLVPDAALPPRRPVPDAALPPASMQAYIPVGESTQGEKYNFHLASKTGIPAEAGMSTRGTTSQRGHPIKPATHSSPGTAFLDSGLRRNDGRAGVGIFSGMVKGSSGRRLTFISPRRHSGEGRNPVIYSIHSRVAGMPNCKINDLRHCQIIGFGAAHPWAACLLQAGTETLIKSGFA